MNVIVEGFGTFLSKKGQRLVVKQKNQKREFAIYKIDPLIIDCRGISFSSDLIKELQSEKINILFCDRDKPIAFINYLDKNPLLTKELLLMPETKKTTFAKEIILKKLFGQMAVLKSLKKTGILSDLEKEESAFEKIRVKISELGENFESSRNQLFALEAEFAQSYWGALSTAIPPEYGFTAREKMSARDALNASLNYGYAILAARTLNCCFKTGLDPTIGILHSIKEKRNSLIFDLMEPYRPLIDRSIITLFTKKIFDLELDFNFKEFLLSKTGKEKVIAQSVNMLSRITSIKNRETSTEKAILYTCYALRDFVSNKSKYFYVVVPE